MTTSDTLNHRPCIKRKEAEHIHVLFMRVPGLTVWQSDTTDSGCYPFFRHFRFSFGSMR